VSSPWKRCLLAATLVVAAGACGDDDGYDTDDGDDTEIDGDTGTPGAPAGWQPPADDGRYAFG
jgi:hypothetical protein